MMAKRKLVSDYDQFIVRMPPGMRDRIKAKAERAGMSMNEAIVWCLEREFPEPVTIEKRLTDLATFVAALKKGDLYQEVDVLADEIHTTLEEIRSGKLKTPKDFRSQVSEVLDMWEHNESDKWQDRNESPFDDELYRDPLVKDD